MRFGKFATYSMGLRERFVVVDGDVDAAPVALTPDDDGDRVPQAVVVALLMPGVMNKIMILSLSSVIAAIFLWKIVLKNRASLSSSLFSYVLADNFLQP